MASGTLTPHAPAKHSAEMSLQHLVQRLQQHLVAAEAAGLAVEDLLEGEDGHLVGGGVDQARGLHQLLLNLLFGLGGEGAGLRAEQAVRRAGSEVEVPADQQRRPSSAGRQRGEFGQLGGPGGTAIGVEMHLEDDKPLQLDPLHPRGG